MEENKNYGTFSEYSFYLANIYQKLHIPVLLFLRTSTHTQNIKHSEFCINK